MTVANSSMRDAFAAHFDTTREIPLVNKVFLDAIRGGAATVDAVYTRVEITLREGLRVAAKSRDTERHTKLDNIIYFFEHFPEEACDYAGYYLWWETLTKAEKDAIRAEVKPQYIEEAMRHQPASEKQVSYLRSLGYNGQVLSKKHASDIIDAITKQGAA